MDRITGHELVVLLFRPAVISSGRVTTAIFFLLRRIFQLTSAHEVHSLNRSKTTL